MSERASCALMYLKSIFLYSVPDKGLSIFSINFLIGAISESVPVRNIELLFLSMRITEEDDNSEGSNDIIS